MAGNIGVGGGALGYAEGGCRAWAASDSELVSESVSCSQESAMRGSLALDVEDLLGLEMWRDERVVSMPRDGS